MDPNASDNLTLKFSAAKNPGSIAKNELHILGIFIDGWFDLRYNAERI